MKTIPLKPTLILVPLEQVNDNLHISTPINDWCLDFVVYQVKKGQRDLPRKENVINQPMKSHKCHANDDCNILDQRGQSIVFRLRTRHVAATLYVCNYVQYACKSGRFHVCVVQTFFLFPVFKKKTVNNR